MFAMGIDVGSASSKAVILDHNAQIVATAVVQIGAGSTGPKRVIAAVLEKSGLALKDIQELPRSKK